MNKVYVIEYYNDLTHESEIHEKAFKQYHKAVNYILSKGYEVIEINKGITKYKMDKYDFATIIKLDLD